MKELSLMFIILLLILLAAVAAYNKGYNKAIRQKPSAIEVYQGKTTLQYTIIDGIKTDSIVVYKINQY